MSNEVTMEKYLYIFEDGSLMISTNLSLSDIESVKAGELQVINLITECSLNRNGNWEKI